MDLEIIEMINQFKHESEPTVEEQIATGALSEMRIGETEIIFEERKLLDGKIKMMMPSHFTILPPEVAELKYPSANRPPVIYGNGNASINVTFNHTETPLEEEEVELFKEYMAENLPKDQTEGEWVGDGLEEINGQTVGYCEFIVPAGEVNIYNILFFLSLNGKALLCSFNCIEEEMEDWQPIARGMLRSLNISSGESAESANQIGGEKRPQEHKAYHFDTKRFNRELAPIILESGSKNDPGPLKKYLEKNFAWLRLSFIEKKKIKENLGDHDIQTLADIALTTFYSPEEKLGLSYSWDSLLEAFKKLPLEFAVEYYIIGKPLKNEIFTLAPGAKEMGFVDEKDILKICGELIKLRKMAMDNGLPESIDSQYEITLKELMKAYDDLLKIYQSAGRKGCGLMFTRV